MHSEVHCSSFKLCCEALHLCVVYGAALPNNCGAPVLDGTCTLRGVHIGTSFHLDTTHQPVGVSLNVFCSGSLALPIGVVCNSEPDTGAGLQVSCKFEFCTTFLL